jgi:hypothetical protein
MKTDTETFKNVKYSGLGMKPMPPNHRKRWNILSFTTGFATSMVLAAVAYTIHHTVSMPKSAAEIEAEDWNYCGRSSKTAMERGCVMEPWFYGWMPPQCVYQELSDTLPVFEDRKYFR